MNNKEVPRLLLHYDLSKIIDIQIEEIDKIIDFNKKDFLYAYTLLEGVLWSIASKIYFAFPEKLIGDINDKTEKFEIEKKEFLSVNNYYNVLRYVIEKKLFKESKAGLNNYLKSFMKIINYEIKYDKKVIEQISLERNKIAHNNSPQITDLRYEKNEILNTKTLKEYIQTIKDLLLQIKNIVNNQYKDYTYKKLLNDSWNFTMPSWISIEEVFDFSTGRAFINYDDAIKVANKISSGEKYLLFIWLENYNYDVAYRIMQTAGVVSKHLGCSQVEESLYLKEMFNLYPYMVNGRNINI